MSLLLCSCKNIFSSKVIVGPIKTFYSRFHTLRKLENVHFRKSTTVTTQRNFFWIFKKLSKRELRLKDKIPDSYKLVYRNGMDNQLLIAQVYLFWASTLLGVTCVFGASYFTSSQELKFTTDQNVFDYKPKDAENQMAVFFAGYVLFASLMYFYIARMPVRIYYNSLKGDYIACTYGVIPHKILKHTIKIGEVEPLNIESKFLWGNITYKHKTGYRMILFDNYFKTMSDLYIMLGVQEDHAARGYDKIDK